MSKVATSSNGSNARKAYTNKVATANGNNTKKANANIAATTNKPAKRKADGNTKRPDINIAATTSKPTKKNENAKIVEMANEIANANINKLANNARRVYANVIITADANVTAATNKAINKAKKYMPMYQ